MPSLKGNISMPAVCAAILFALFSSSASFGQYTISTVAGGGPNGLAALSSSIGYPGSIAFDSSGNAYIADASSSLILKVKPGGSTGTVTIVAGNGSTGYSGDGGPATSATLDGPVGVALDSAGNIYIADTGNNRIRVVNTGAQTATIAGVSIQPGFIATVAGTGVEGYAGDGAAATSAQLYGPLGVFVDGSGNVFIGDSLNDAVREVSASTGNIQTVAGNGTYCADPTTACGDGGVATSANLDLPSGVFVDASGNIYIADTYTARIRVVNAGTGVITTIAGAYYQTQGGTECAPYVNPNPPNPPIAATAAQLCAPTGVYVDSAGDIFIVDSYNSVIDEVASGSSNITTVAGTGTAGYSGNTGAATSAQLDSPNYAFVDNSGDIYVADTDNYVIREVTGGNINAAIGNNSPSYSGDGGAATDAQLNAPNGVFVAGSDSVYIADTDSAVIRLANLGTSAVTINGIAIQPSDIQTVAGDAKAPCQSPTSTPACNDGSPALSAQFDSPSGVATDAAGNIYIADTADNRIRVVNTGSSAITIVGVQIGAGDVGTVAGNGYECTLPFATWPCGDGGAPTIAEIFQPQSVFVDSAGNIFIADTEDHAIRVVNTGTAEITLAGVQIPAGSIATVAGNGTKCSQNNSPCGDGAASKSAQLSFPWGIFVDSSENLYIADSGDNRIRVVNTGTQAVTIAGVSIQPGFIATVAGTGVEGYAGDGAAALSAELAGPTSLFVDSSGNIYVSDTANFVVREVVSSTGFIGTIAGNNTAGFSGDGGTSTSAQINALGVSGDSSGNIFIADIGNSRVRQLTPGATSQPSANSPQAQTVSAGGTASFDIQLTAHTGDPRYAITLSCAQSSLPPNATCSFSPSKITPGPAPVPFTLSVNVPANSAALQKPSGKHLELVFAFVPLAGILFGSAAGLKNKKSRWLLLAVLGGALILLNACGGSSSGSGSGTKYTIQVQGTTAVQPTPFAITTATLTVQ
jgi:sugar lactone lactonase YvrE